MLEFLLTITSAVLAGLILDFILNNSSITKKSIKKIFKGLNKKPHEKILIYLSSGGTCRDPIAKSITLKLLENKELNFKLKVEGMALGPISNNNISYAARNAIRELYGIDLLSGYKPQTVTKELLDKADLILVMDRSLMLEKILPKHKTYVFKDFFGLDGDIDDPWPDGKDEMTLNRYLKCAKEIKKILEKNINNLIKAIQI
jgi:protein-tyrosine-phosphatase